MAKDKIKYVNINELQANISKIVKEVKSGYVYKVMRYSDPTAVVLSNKDYEKILATLNTLRASCRKCVLPHFISSKLRGASPRSLGRRGMHIDKVRRRK